jgi:chromosome partitioning protein
MTTIAVANQKGGVGKTTTVVNVAAFAALAGKRTLVVDCDPQGNASSVLAPPGEHDSIYSGQGPLPVAGFDGLSVIPAGDDLITSERRLVTTEGGRFVLKRRLADLQADFDLIVVDCPPSLTLLSVNALNAADRVLIPIQCEYFAMEGLSQLVAALDEIREDSNPNVAIGGIVLTMCDARLEFARQVAAEIRRHFGSAVFETVIPRDIALAAAPSHGRTIIDYDPLSPGGVAYLALTKEVLDGLR